jgi:hypothetical protein
MPAMRASVGRRGAPEELVELPATGRVMVVAGVDRFGSLAQAEPGGIEAGVRVQRVALEPCVSPEPGRVGDADDQVAPASLPGLPRLEHYRPHQAALAAAAERRANASLGLGGKARRSRGCKRRLEALDGKQASGAARRPKRPPGRAQVGGMQPSHSSKGNARSVLRQGPGAAGAPDRRPEAE